MRRPKWPGKSLNFQFSETIVSPGRNIPPYRSKTSGQIKHETMGTESKNFASEVTVVSNIRILISVSLGAQRRGTYSKLGDTGKGIKRK